MKILDFLNKVIYKGKMPQDFDNTQQNAFASTVGSLAKTSSQLKLIQKQIDEYNHALIAAKEKVKNAQPGVDKKVAIQQAEVAGKKLYEAELKYEKLDASITKLLNNMGKKFNLTGEQIDGIAQHINDNSEDLEQTSARSEKAFNTISKVARNGFEGLLESAGNYFIELGVIGEVIAAALTQMEGLNKKMVDFNRNMSLGFSNKMLGMDLYGNSKNGSLTTIAGTKGVSEDEFLNAIAGFKKGNSLGNTNDFSKSQNDMQKFGIEAAQLSKFYGVEMGTINTITSNLVYNFGAKIKDLNEVFEHGKEVATAAGISVKGYFENLKEASDQVGKNYIAGGVQGMEKLAIYAAKTGQSVNGIMQTADQFKNYTSQWQLQNTAAAHAMNETANNISKIWALNYTGKQAEADQLYKGSLAKDIVNNGFIDGKGNIDNNGTRNLQRMNVSPEDIATVQRYIKMQKELGITVEQYLNSQNESVEIQKKVNKFDNENLTNGEKLSMLWKKIKGSILDPIAGVLSPIVDGLINVISVATSIIAPILSAVMWPIKQFGQLLGWIGDMLSDFYYAVKPALDTVGGAMTSIKEWLNSNNMLAEVMKWTAKAIGAVIGGMMTWWAIQKMSGGISNLFGGAKNLINGARGISGIGEAGIPLANAGGGGIMSSIGNAVKNGWGTLRGGIGSLNGARGALEKGLLPGGEAAMEAGFAPATGLMSKIPVGLLGKLPTGANLLKGGLIGAGIGIGGNLLGGAVGGRSGETIKTAANWAGTGATIGTLIAPGIGTAIGAIIGGVGGMVKDSWADIDKIWEDGSTGLWASLEHHSISTLKDTYNWIKSNTIANTAFNQLYSGIPALVDGITNLNGNLEKKSDNFNISPNLMNSYTDTDSAWKKIMEQRKSDIPMAAEAAREERMKRDYNPQIHVNVNTTFDKVAKTRIQNKA